MYKRKTKKITVAAQALLFVCLGIFTSSSEAGPTSSYRAVKTIPLQALFKTRSNWSVTAYQTGAAVNDGDETTDEPAKLCFIRATDKRQDCTKITSGLLNNQGFVYNYQTVKDLRIVRLKSGVWAVEFHAEFYGGGSGMAEQTSLWTYDKKSDSFWSALTISSTEMGGYKIIDNGPLAGYVVAASPEWQIDKDEGHFAPHQVQMAVYRLSGQFYLKVLSYLTTQKYGGEDESDGDPLDQEMPRITKLLKEIGQ